MSSPTRLETEDVSENLLLHDPHFLEQAEQQQIPRPPFLFFFFFLGLVCIFMTQVTYAQSGEKL